MSMYVYVYVYVYAGPPPRGGATGAVCPRPQGYGGPTIHNTLTFMGQYNRVATPARKAGKAGKAGKEAFFSFCAGKTGKTYTFLYNGCWKSWKMEFPVKYFSCQF